MCRHAHGGQRRHHLDSSPYTHTHTHTHTHTLPHTYTLTHINTHAHCACVCVTGKSTLLNQLSTANVLAEDKLFATLDPTTRNIR